MRPVQERSRGSNAEGSGKKKVQPGSTSTRQQPYVICKCTCVIQSGTMNVLIYYISGSYMIGTCLECVIKHGTASLPLLCMRTGHCEMAEKYNLRLDLLSFLLSEIMALPSHCTQKYKLMTTSCCFSW